MGNPFDNRMLSLTFSFGGGRNVALQEMAVAPTPDVPQGLPADVVDGGGPHPAVTLGMSAAGAVGAHLLANLIVHGKLRYTVKDALLDGLSGAALGTCFIGSPAAEGMCLGALSAVPMALVNKLDVRYNMLTQGTLRMGLSLVGGNPLPFDGRKNGTAAASGALSDGELLGNAVADITLDALRIGVGSSAAALLDKKDAKSVVRAGLIGAGYGGAQGLVANAVMGTPYKPDPALLEAGAKKVAEHGGVEVSDMIGHTTFRTGGMLLGPGIGGMTLPGNVLVASGERGDATTYGHELVHRDQFAGGFKLTAPGLLRPGAGAAGGYSQYLWDVAENGYNEDVYEREAYTYADGRAFRAGAPLDQGPHWGSLLSAGLALGLYGWGSKE